MCDYNDHQLALSDSAERLLRTICSNHNLPPLDADTRRKLAAAGHEEALHVLGIIAASATVRRLPGFIIHLLRRESSSPPPPPPASPTPKNPRVYGSLSRNGSVESEGPRGSGRAEIEALGELEFRKQFLILNYIGGNELHNVITAEEIRNLKSLEMKKFEEQLWKRFGGKSVERQDRRVCNDWDSGRTHVYHCHVSQNGDYRFKGPFLESTKTHLQKVVGDDNVLMVKFAEGVTSHGHNHAVYRKIAREGILVGLRCYRFFVFKDGGKEEKKKNPTSSPVKCFFVRIHSEASVDQTASYILSDKSFSEVRWLFMHAHTVSSVSTYMARFSLILSKTLKMNVDLSTVKINITEDEYCMDESGQRVYRDGKPLIHTDGTGFISEDLALLCPKNSRTLEHINDNDIKIISSRDELASGFETQEPPMLIQFRMFNNGYAVKGTLLVNKKLEPRTIQIRHSMVKVEPDSKLSSCKSVNSLEVVGTSNPPKKTFLSRYLIALLSYGGVPDSFFMDLLGKALKEADGAFTNKRASFKAAMNYGNIDSDFTVARMISCGIPLEEPYLQYRLSIFMKEEKKSLRGGKIHIPDCFYLMGTTDPTGKLEKDEVCIVLDKGQVSGNVLVYRNPGLHFGDIHILKATYIEELISFVGNAKYAIFFPRNGPRSIADEIAGGDFDGDMYWVSMNLELLKHFKASEPWIQKPSTGKVESKRPDQFSAEELEDELFELFLTTRFAPSFAISEAADSWLALMDRFLTLEHDCAEEKKAVKENIIKLIDIYYDALDAPKKGTKVEVPRDLRPKRFPHYMEREHSFQSESVLGKIYNVADAYEPEDLSKKEIQKLPCFDVDIPEDCLNKWKVLYKKYREEMTDALNITERGPQSEAADKVKKKYKKLLYGAEELEESTRNMNDVFNEALAVYHLSYDYAASRGSVSKCSFAWNIAGSALYMFHAMKNAAAGERTFVMLQSVLKELF